MKAIIYFCVAGLITGCADQGYVSRWNDMWVDIAIRHQYEKYSCAHALEGYSKDPVHVSERKRARPAPEQGVVKTHSSDIESAKQTAQQTSATVRELSAKIDALEDALKTNAATTNQNQNLLVQQINALKAQLAQLQKTSSRAPEK